MPGPPPPPPMAPPSMMPPPPPAFAPTPSKGGGGDDRGALLKSIRQGTKLKKAVTNDRSGPIVGKVENSSNSMSNSSSSVPSSVPNGIGGLGGLFAGGMPKLRPTGKLSAPSNNVSNNASETPKHISKTPQAPRGFGASNEIQSALKKQMASDSNRQRGPPPPAPTRNIGHSAENLTTIQQKAYTLKNGSANGLKLSPGPFTKSSSHLNSPGSVSPNPEAMQFPGLLQANASTLHRKANSSANLSSLDGQNENQGGPVPMLSGKPHPRKPHLAPKPPTTNGKPVAPPKKLIMNGRAGVQRAHSCRSPNSPSPQSPDDFGGAQKFGTVRNMSSALDKALGQNFGAPKSRPALNGRPSAPPPSVPPPPPSKTGLVKPPSHAPPPPPNVIPQPPTHAPPPPPHRTNLPTRAPPAIPVANNSSLAPPPPPRHSSMREPATTNRRTSPVDLDTKFRDNFHTVSEFPNPPPFRKVPKFYSNRTVANKQPAPLPPNHINLNSRLWDSSTC